MGGTRMIMLTAASINLLDSTGDVHSGNGNTGPVTGGDDASDQGTFMQLQLPTGFLRLLAS